MISLRSRFSTAARSWILLAGIGQATMPGIASIVDAYPSAASAMAAIRPHIESHGSPKCPRVHQEDNCALCQFVSGVVAVAPSDAHARAACAQSFVVAVAPELLPTWLVDGDPSLPRAPPEKA
jgi:hypothetical protein